MLYPKDGSGDEIEDPEADVGSQAVREASQDSHDSIESWSAV